MTPPTVSVVIPVYNQADYVGEAVQSVVAQTYHHLEIIVVSDASPDNTADVVGQFHDPRITYIEHESNRGLPATRNTGIRASTGEILAFLDADDLFHRNKIARHVALLQDHPDIGGTYNPRFEIENDGRVLDLWRPQRTVGLADFVLGFPFAPSDMVLRRDWAFHVGLFDEQYVNFSEDLDITCRLALAGCRFASIDRALNYRRYSPNRVIRNAGDRLAAALHALEMVFDDPRCPDSVRARRSQALGTTYMIWSYEAFMAGDTAHGQHMLRQASAHDPSIVANNARRLLEFLEFRSTQDGSDHDICLRHIFDQLPSELTYLRRQANRVIANGYLRRGVRDVMWRQSAHAGTLFAAASEYGASLNENTLRRIADQLLNYEREYGAVATDSVLHRLSHHLQTVGSRGDVRWLQGCHAINRAFGNYQMQRYARVPACIFEAIRKNPTYITNRGVLIMLLRSMLGRGRSARSSTATSNTIPPLRG